MSGDFSMIQKNVQDIIWYETSYHNTQRLLQSLNRPFSLCGITEDEITNGLTTRSVLTTVDTILEYYGGETNYNY